MFLINYKMTLQYEGTRYRGWQKQPGVENTIQGKLETLLTRLMGSPIEVYGAGRTDAGVHAMGQVASFRVPQEKLRMLALSSPLSMAGEFSAGISADSSGRSFDDPRHRISADMTENISGESFDAMARGSADCDLPEFLPSEMKAREDRALFEALNRYLPEDIAVRRLVRASERFHARYLTSSKWYQYRIRTSCVSDVFHRRFLWQYGQELNTERMKEGAKALTGRHDFASFCGLKMKKSTVRTVHRIEIRRPDEETILLDYYGDGFLNHMVRLMTGELVEAGAGRISPGSIALMLEQCRKGAASHTAPASGLTLMEVRY